MPGAGNEEAGVEIGEEVNEGAADVGAAEALPFCNEVEGGREVASFKLA